MRPISEHHDAIGKRQRFLLIVRHQDRDAEGTLELIHLDLQRLTQLAVERAQRLVEEQDIRLENERAQRAVAGRPRAARDVYRRALPSRTNFKASTARSRASELNTAPDRRFDQSPTAATTAEPTHR